MIALGGEPRSRLFHVRTSAKDRYDFVATIHLQAEHMRLKELQARMELQRQREESSRENASVAETFHDVRLQDDSEKVQDWLMTVGD